MYYSTIKTANCAKIKKLSSQEGIQRGKMCTTDLQPFRPIPIFDQFLFPTNSYFRPIPISDQFLFQTMQIVRLAHFQESTASVRPLVETKNIIFSFHKRVSKTFQRRKYGLKNLHIQPLFRCRLWHLAHLGERREAPRSSVASAPASMWERGCSQN